MAYPRNAASPPHVAIGAVVQISDGAVQTTGITVYHRTSGTTENSGGGTTNVGATTGTVYYTPTQAETNYESFELVAFKTGCIPTAVTVVTSASATAGKVVLSGETHTSAVIPTVTTLTGHTAQTGDCYARLGAPAGASHAADVAAVKSDTAAVKAKTDNLPTDPADQSAVEAAITAATSTLATAANLAIVAGYIDTEIAAILADTDELQKDWTNNGRLDLLIDAIKAKTDLMLDATAVENAVWNASQSSHTSAGTFGLYVDAKVSEAGGGGLTAAAIADAVWDEVATGHTDSGKAGAQLWTVINTLSSGSAIHVTSSNVVIESE